MWRFNDALQTTAPVFIRIQYCSDISTTNGPSLLITVGTGTDGAGGLTGQVTNPTNITKGNKNETVADLSYVCGKDGLVVVAMFLDSAAKLGSQMFFSVERTRDASGAYTVDGVVMLSNTQGAAPTTNLLWFAGGSPTKEASYWQFLLPVTALTGAWNGDVAVSPIYTCWGQVRPPGICQVVYKQADFVNGELIVASMYGVSHTFRAMYTNFSAGFSTGYAGNPSLAMLWE
jgi:hypothetical protein